MTTPEPTAADYQASYGFVAMLGNSVPEIKGLLDQAVREKWTPQRFSMAVNSTSWWKNTGAANREWIVKLATDPTTAAQQQLAGADDIRNRAALLGVPLMSVEDAKHLWLRSKLEGLTDDSLNAAIFRTSKGYGSPLAAAQQAGGRYGQLINEMFRAAEDYGYVEGDWQKSSAVGEIVNAANTIMASGGSANAEAWKTKMINYASTKYAPFADRIRAGETVNDIARPYKQALAETWETAESDIGLNEGLLARALQGVPPENGGNPIGMPVWQLQMKAREDVRWRKTDNAKAKAAEMATELGKMFGKIAS